MRKKINITGDKDEYRKSIRKFQLDELLKAINNDCANIMNSMEMKGYYPYEKRIQCKGYHSFQLELVVTAWDYIDLAYYAILFTNDYRGEICNIEELHLLLAGCKNYIDNTKEFEQYFNNATNVGMYVLGFGGEQFKFQDITPVINNMKRDLYILLLIAKDNSEEYNAEVVVHNKYEMTWDRLYSYLYIAYVTSLIDPNILKAEKYFNFQSPFSFDEYEDIISAYSSTYEEVKKSRLKRQVLYTTPYIKTDHNEIVSINPYLNLFLLEHTLLWIIRDELKNAGENGFPAYFGVCFEKYVEEVLYECIGKDCFKRLVENNESMMADWYINIDEYSFIVEQKSALVQLGIKQQETDVDLIKKYSQTVIKALRQLKATEDYLNNGKMIKIVLLYEDYFHEGIIDELFQLSDCEIKDDNYYWLININTFESLIALSCNNIELFKSIVAEKIDNSCNENDINRPLSDILKEHNVPNEYIGRDKFSYYRDMICKNIVSLMK